MLLDVVVNNLTIRYGLQNDKRSPKNLLQQCVRPVPILYEFSGLGGSGTSLYGHRIHSALLRLCSNTRFLSQAPIQTQSVLTSSSLPFTETCRSYHSREVANTVYAMSEHLAYTTLLRVTSTATADSVSNITSYGVKEVANFIIHHS